MLIPYGKDEMVSLLKMLQVEDLAAEHMVSAFNQLSKLSKRSIKALGMVCALAGRYPSMQPPQRSCPS